MRTNILPILPSPNARIPALVTTAMLLLSSPLLAQTSAAFSLTTDQPPASGGDIWVPCEKPFDLNILVTPDTPLVAARFDLDRTSADGVGCTVVARSLSPTTGQLTYLSATSQTPFADGLPFDLVTQGPLRDFILDLDPSDGDGLAPGSDLLLETLTVEFTGTYGQTIDLFLAQPQAATTSAAPDGTMFDTVSVAGTPITLNMTVPDDFDRDGDVDGVDFSVFAVCFNGAGNPPRTLGCSPTDADCADIDDDGDVDGVDFSVFGVCFNKAGNPPRTAGCPCAGGPQSATAQTSNPVSDVTVRQFTFFAACYNGPDSPPRKHKDCTPQRVLILDADRDNDVDEYDFLKFAQSFNR